MYIVQWSSSRIFLVHENENNSIYTFIKKTQTVKVPLSFILVTDSKQIQACTGVKTDAIKNDKNIYHIKTISVCFMYTVCTACLQNT